LGCECLPPREFEDEKRRRQYEHIKESELARGASEVDAERIAAATVNKTSGKKVKHSEIFLLVIGYRRIYSFAAGKNLYLNV
jgi:hypothetical protein